MEINFTLNGKKHREEVKPGTMAIDFLRGLGCKSIKRGCDSSSCGLCSILVDGQAVLSCSMPAPGLHGKTVLSLEGLQEEARVIGSYLAAEGTEQCGYCTPGFIIAVIAMTNELTKPTDEEILSYLAGNLCRCSGYEGQIRAIRKFMDGDGHEA